MNKTRKITEGAMLSAIIGVFLLLNRQTAGAFDFILYWIIPLPIVVYTVKYGTRDALLPYVVTILLAFVLGMPTGIYYAIIGGFLGIIYGTMANKHKDSYILLLVSCIISIISTFVTLFLLSSLFGYSIQDDIMIIKETVAVFNEYLETSNMIISDGFIIKMAILVEVCTGAIEGLLVHMLCFIVLKRLKLTTFRIRTVFEIHLPRVIGYALAIIYIGIYGLMLMNPPFISAYIDIIYFIYFICLLIFWINGYIAFLAILAFYKKRKLVFLSLLGIFPPFSVFMQLLGVIDAISDFRNEVTFKRVMK